VTGIRPVNRRSALSAEPLLSTVRRLPHPQRLLTRDDPERSRSRMRLRRGRGATSPLTPFAMAVTRPHQRRRHLVADRAAITATGERKPHGTCRISHDPQPDAKPRVEVLGAAANAPRSAAAPAYQLPPGRYARDLRGAYGLASPAGPRGDDLPRYVLSLARSTCHRWSAFVTRLVWPLEPKEE
jgi:hypothetical protein